MHLVRHELPGELITEFDARGVHAAALAHGSGEVHVWRVTFEPEGEIGPHVAGFDQLFCVLEGSAWVEVDGVRLDVATSTSALIRRGEIHAKGSSGGASVLMVQLTTIEA